MTEKSDNNLQTGVSQSYQAIPEVDDKKIEARVIPKNGPLSEEWWKDRLETPFLELANDSKAETEKTKVSLKSTIAEIKEGVVKAAKRVKGYLIKSQSEKEDAILKVQKKAQVETLVEKAEEQTSVAQENDAIKPSIEELAQAVEAAPELAVEEPIDEPSSVAAPDTELVVEEPEEAVPTPEELAVSLADKITDIIAEAEEELKNSNDVVTGIIVGLAKDLNTELRKEKLNWSKIDFLVRQLSVMIVQKMANNDHKTIQEELDQLQRDIDKVAQTYKGKWELALGILSGACSMVGGAIGLGGGFGALGGVASSTLKSLQGVSQAFGSIGQGVGQFGQIARNANERDRAVFNYHMERDRGYKSSAEASIQANRTAKNAQFSQLNSSIEAAYRAWLAVAQ